MGKVRNVFGNIEKTVSVAILLTILLVLTYQIFMRYIFSNTPEWSEELSRYLFIWLIFLSGSFAVQKNAHIKIDSVEKIYPRKIKKIVFFLGDIVWLCISIFILYISTKFTIEQYFSGSMSIALKTNMAFAYAAIPIGYLFLIIRIMGNIYDKYFSDIMKRVVGNKKLGGDL